MITQIQKWQRVVIKSLSLFVLMCLLTFICAVPVSGAQINDDAQQSQTQKEDKNSSLREPTKTTKENENFQLNISSNAGSTSLSATLQMLLMLTILSIAPSILLMATSFTRIIIVLHFVRSALGTQTTPPNQVLIGFALFLTFFIMNPVFTQINTNAIKPLSEGIISQEEALKAGIEPMREFMFEQTEPSDLRLFLEIADMRLDVEEKSEVPTTVLVPAFMVGELRKAFTMGFIIYLPFIVIDMVVSSTLMSMGMMMLPPTVISMPFKILLFIMADGWSLVIGETVKAFFVT